MTGACISEIGIEDYSRRLMGSDGRRRVPLSGTLELTFRCNNRCAHCYVNKGIDDRGERQRELTTAEICHILDDIAEEGCLWLLLTGGEPLVREDFKDIYLHAKNKGFLITLFTNGTLIDPALADLLREFPPRSIEVTLYGATEETYERVTRSPGSYRSCVQGIRLLLERDLPLKPKSVILTLNRHEFWAMKKFVEELGLEFRFDALINGRVDRARDVTTLRIPPHEVVELDKSDPRRGPEFVRLYERAAGIELPPDLLYRCGVGLRNFYVDPYGNLVPCTLARSPRYDLRRGNFKEGWRDFLPAVREQRFQRENPCRGCDLIGICDQCPGWSQLESGDPEIPVDYLCQVAHLRAEAFGIGR
jgi:radical SAM protein with 4Fe4S-binding SPASM domain